MLRVLYRLCLAALLSTTSLSAATPSPTLAAEASPNGLVAGCVDILSGGFVLQDSDVHLGGPDPISFTRSYSSNVIQKSYWGHSSGCDFPLRLEGIDRKASSKKQLRTKLHLREYAGTPFWAERKKTNGAIRFRVDPALFRAGATHLPQTSQPAAQNNLQNLELLRLGPGDWELSSGSGTRRQYNYIAANQRHLRLTSEQLPSGNQRHYQYDVLGRLTQVYTSNAAGDQVWNELSIDYDGLDGYTVRSSDGQEAYYHLRLVPQRYRKNGGGRKETTHIRYVDRVEGAHFPSRHYTLHASDRDSWINKYSRIRDAKGEQMEVSYCESGRVRLLSLADPQTGILQKAYSFAHIRDEKGRHCDVKTPFSRESDHYHSYYFDKYRRIKRVDYGLKRSPWPYYRVSSPSLSDHYHWQGLTDKTQRGFLLAKYSNDSDGRTLQATAFAYDGSGNVLEERLYGSLCKDAVAPFTFDTTKQQAEGTDCYRKRYTYSDDGFNLLTSEYEPDGSGIRYEYRPGTNLVVKCLHEKQQRVLRRQFFDYDDCAVLTMVTEDDGLAEDISDLRGVHCRRIQRITPERENRAAFGKPREHASYYLELDSGQERLLEKWVYHYDERGLCVQRDRYDADGCVAYSEYDVFDERRLLVQSINALGEVTEYSYDDRHLLTSTQLLGSGCRTAYSYNSRGEYVATQLIGEDGSGYSERKEYHLAGVPSREVDRYGGVTDYEYDIHGRQVAVTDSSGTVRKEYDALGNCVAVIDRRGNRTESSYNLRGQPIRIAYPDGSAEDFEYSIRGQLIRKRERNGTEVHFTYDPQGHVSREEALGKDYHSVKTYNYYGDLLLEENDNGRTTRFQYDGAGRLIESSIADRRSSYHYDSMGRRSEERQYLPDGSWITSFTAYDALDRVIETRKESQGKILSKIEYVYDIDGNELETREWVSPTEVAITQKAYSDAGELINLRDALGNESRYEYKHSADGLSVIATDPMGRQDIDDYDLLGRKCRSQAYNPAGQPIAETSYTYDPNGNLVRQQEIVFTEAGPSTTYTVLSEYDSMDRLIRQVEEPNTDQQRSVSYRYNASGELRELVKADGSSLYYDYNGAGSLIRQWSSDGTVDDRFHYNTRQQAIQAKNLVSGDSVARHYSELGELCYEEINSYAVRFAYDSLGRRSSVQLGQNPAINYLYAGGRLREIHWGSYVHRYSNYNWRGKSRKQQLIGRAGTLELQRDLLGRPIELDSSHWQMSVPQDGYDPMGNLRERHVRDPVGSYTQSADYDQWYQLKAEKGPFTASYNNDSLSNIHVKNGSKQELNQLNQLTATETARYRYDLNGNLIEEESAEGLRRFHYDALDRLIAVQDGENTIHFAYDPFNRRISKNSILGKQSYVYDGDIEIAALNKDGLLAEQRILGPGVAADMGAAVAIILDDHVYAPIHDPIGNVACLIDADTGSLVESYRLSAYGAKKTYSFRPTGNPWVLSCKREDPETDLIYFGRRYYSPQLCRWITADPGRFHDGPNLYAYVHGNPFCYFDPYGLQTWKQWADESTSIQAGIGLALAVWDMGVTVCQETADVVVLSGQLACSPIQTAKAVGSTVGGGCRKMADYVGEHGWGTGSALLEKGQELVSAESERFMEMEFSEQCRYASYGGMYAAWTYTGGSLLRGLSALSKSAKVVNLANKASKLSSTSKQVTKLSNLSTKVSSTFRKAGVGIKAQSPCLWTVFGTAQESYKGSSKVGHALSKHAGRHPEVWGKLKGPPGQWNAQGLQHLREIVDGPGQFKIMSNGGPHFLEKRLADGRGLRLNLDSTFKGFID